MNRETEKLAIALRHELHAHPELSSQETWTKQHLMNFLREHTKLEIVDKGLWFFARYTAGQDRRNLAFRSELDALEIEEQTELPFRSRIPGIGHMCGHDGHSSALAAFAVEVDRLGAENNIYFLFQHGEELGDGGIVCQEMIREYHINEIYAFHNMPGYEVGDVIIHRGLLFSPNRGITMTFQGVPAHASEPEKGSNPIRVIQEILDGLGLWIQHTKEG